MRLPHGFIVAFDACSQRETAAAHSGAAWERLKDSFTLSDTPVEIIDSDSSLGHKFKVGWNNGMLSRSSSSRHSNRPQPFVDAGVRSFRDTVRGVFEK